MPNFLYFVMGRITPAAYMRRIFIFLWVGLICGHVQGQSPVVDSLTRALGAATSVREQGRLHMLLARELMNIDTVKAQEHLAAGLADATQTADPMGLGMHALYLGYMVCDHGKYEEGISLFSKAEAELDKFILAKSATEKEQQEALSYRIDAELSRGNVLLELYRYDEAIRSFWSLLQELDSTDAAGKSSLQAAAYQSMALAYFHLSQYQQASRYYLQSYSFAVASGDESLQARTDIYIGMCYRLTGQIDSATYYLKRAAPVVNRLPDMNLKLQFFARSAEVFRSGKHYDSAVLYYDRAIQFARNTDNTYMQATFTNARAKTFLEWGKTREARESGLAALALASSINKQREILNIQELLHKVEAAAGNYKEAYKYLSAYNAGMDSLHTTEMDEKMQELDAQYQTRLKEEQISRLEKEKSLQALSIKQKNTLNAVLGGTMGSVALIFVLSYRSYRQRQRFQQRRIQELETERKLQATEAVLKGEEQERARLARDLHDGLSGMLSGVKYTLQDMKGNTIMTEENQQAFERSMDMLDNSIREMRRVAHNMMPEVLVRYGLDAALKDYTSEINRSGIIRVIYQSMGVDGTSPDQSTALAVYRIVQELLNNVIKHAGASEALVQLFAEDGKLVVNVEDNGKGFDTSLSEEKGGMGWRNIRSRVELLNGHVDVQSVPGKGTSVNVELNPGT